MFHRLRLLVVLLVLVGSVPVFAQGPAGRALAEPDVAERAAPAPAPGERAMGESQLTDEARQAVSGGLRFIVGHQDMETGLIAQPNQRQWGIATTALGGMALIASGSVPGRGPFAENVEMAVRYLLSTQGDAGYFSTRTDQSRIHGHGYATQFLALTYGMMRESELRESLRRALTRAVRLTEGAQTDLGGWGYTPDDRQFDEASTTVTQIQALRACRDVGIRVSDEVIRTAVRYIFNSSAALDWTDHNGNSRQGYYFLYSLRWPTQNRVSFPLTAASITALHGTGSYEGRVIQGGLDWIYHTFLGHVDLGDAHAYERWFHYAHHYAAQAMYQASDSRYWNNYFPRLRDELLRRSKRTDVRVENRVESRTSWESPYGEVYATAISCLLLQIPRGYFPTFQR